MARREGFRDEALRRPYVSDAISDGCKSCKQFWLSALHVEFRCFIQTNEWPALRLTAHVYGQCTCTHEAAHHLENSRKLPAALTDGRWSLAGRTYARKASKLAESRLSSNCLKQEINWYETCGQVWQQMFGLHRMYCAKYPAVPSLTPWELKALERQFG